MKSYLLEQHRLSRYGDCYGLRTKINSNYFLDEIKEYNNSWTIVARSQPTNERFYLDITSPDGSIGHGTVSDYNKINNTSLAVDEFNVFTNLYHKSLILQESLSGFDGLGRSAVLKMNRGGYFPPHRDMRTPDYNLFRVIIPLRNTGYPDSCLMLEDKVISLEEGRFYYFNAAKMHSLFYMGIEPSYWILLNVITNENNLNYIEKSLQYS